MLDRPPRHDLEAERAVLSAAMLNPDACDELLGELRTDGSEFYGLTHRVIWQAIAELRDAGEVVELTAVASRLNGRQHGGGAGDALQFVGGPAALVEIADATPAILNAGLHAKTVRDLARLRSAQQLCNRFAHEAYGDVGDVDECLQHLEAAVYEAAAAAQSQSAGTWYREDVVEAMVDIQRAGEGHPTVRAVPTGFHALDEHVGGFASGDLWYVAGRPGQGKTAAACGMAEASARDGWAWLNLSLEMSREKLRWRAIARESRIPARALKSGQLSSAQWIALTEAVARLAAMPIQTDEIFHLTPSMMRAKVRRWLSDLRRKHPNAKPAGVIVDHVQLTDIDDAKGKTRNDQLTLFSRSLKALAKEFGIAVMALSQLNRPKDGRKPSRPQLTDLRESGALEQDADVVLFVHRPAEYESEPITWPDTSAEFVVGKGRDVGTGLHKMIYDGPTTRFYEDDSASDTDPRDPPLGRSWSPGTRPVPRPHNEAAERDDPGEGLMDDGFGGLPRN